MHWLWDIADQLGLHCIVLDALVIERIHLHVKKVAAHVTNTSMFERSVLSATVTDHFDRLRTLHIGSGLQGPRAMLSEGVAIAKAASVQTLLIKTDDVVFRPGSLGVVAACLEAGETLAILVDVFSDVRELSAHSVKANKRILRREIWTATDVQLALAWYRSSDADITAVLE